MFDHAPKEREALSWAYAVFWAGLTYVTVPYVRVGVTYVSQNMGSGIFTYTVAVLVVLAAVWALYSIRHRLTVWSCLWLVGIAGLIVFLAFGLAGESPVEAVHYVQYGTLSILLFRAFSHRISDYSIYVAVTLTGTLAGMVDETIQWLTPDRFFDLRDVWLNCKATALVQIGLAAGIRPKMISGWPGWASMKRVCLLGAVTLGYFGLCLQNTPERVAWYAQSVPGLGFVNPLHNVMVEYGHLHGADTPVSFRSRLTLEELGQAASRHAEPDAPDLDFIHDREIEADYSFRALLLTNVFLYEGRLHQLRRDQRLVRAEESDNAGRKAQDFAAAYWENAILQDHFSEVAQGTRYEWSPEMASEVRAAADLSQAYHSSISTHLVVAFNARQLALLSLCGVVALLFGAILCQRAQTQTRAE